MDNIATEIKDLEAILNDNKSDGFTKCDCRQKLMQIKDKTHDKSTRRYIDEILKKA